MRVSDLSQPSRIVPKYRYGQNQGLLKMVEQPRWNKIKNTADNELEIKIHDEQGWFDMAQV